MNVSDLWVLALAVLAGLVVGYEVATWCWLRWHNRRRVSLARAMGREAHLARFSRALVLQLEAPPSGRHAAPPVVDAELVDDEGPDLSVGLPALGMSAPSGDEVVAAVRAVRGSMPPGWRSTEDRMQERALQRQVDAIVRGPLRIASAR